MKEAKRLYEAVTPKDFITLLKNTRKGQTGMTHRMAYILAYGSGLRISEVNSVVPDNIDFNSKTIMIRQAKGKKDRLTFLSKYFKKVYLPKLPIKIGERAMTRAFQRHSAPFNSVLYVDKKGVSRLKYHFHCLRHSFAVNALKNGVPINAVQRMLGHANLATTSRYTQLSPHDAIQAFLDKDL
jgi:site-specific recombinase XerD